MTPQQGQERWFAAWREADEAFLQASSRAARAEAMLRQLEAREMVERWSWTERRMRDDLRRRAIEDGAWSLDEAIAHLGRIDWVERHRFVLANVDVFPEAWLPALLALVSTRQFGDGCSWYESPETIAELQARLASSIGSRAPSSQPLSESRRETNRASTSALLARYGEPCGARFHPTLLSAARLLGGELRREVLALYLAEVRRGHGHVRLGDMCSALPLAEGEALERLVAEVLAMVHADKALDEEDRISGIATVIGHLPTERAGPLAERILDAIVRSAIGRTWAGDRLLAIPDAVWALLPDGRWELAVAWLIEHDALEFTNWTGFDARQLPARLREVLALYRPTTRESATMKLVTSSAGGNAGPVEQLGDWTYEWSSLSPAARVARAPEVHRAVSAILELPDTNDFALRDALPILSEASLHAIWSARASASAWRRTIDLTDDALFAYIASEHYLHDTAVLRLVLALADAATVRDFAAMLVRLGSS